MIDLNSLTKYEVETSEAEPVTLKYNGKVAILSKKLARQMKNVTYVEIYHNSLDTIALKVVQTPGIGLEVKGRAGMPDGEVSTQTTIPFVIGVNRGTYNLVEADEATQTFLFNYA